MCAANVKSPASSDAAKVKEHITTQQLYIAS